MEEEAQFALSYSGSDAKNHQIDFYDVAEALHGFQRSLALTTHLVLNGKVITQAPALKGASIRAKPPQEGSWEIVAVVTILAGAYKLGTAPKNTPIGYIVYSAYDYVIKSLLGVEVDYEKTLRELVEERKQAENQKALLGQGAFDALSEKCESSVAQIHRPIINSESATRAKLQIISHDQRIQVGKTLTAETYEHVAYTVRSDSTSSFVGRVTGYYSNSFKGRIFLFDIGRSIPFELKDAARGKNSLGIVMSSLSVNTLGPSNKLEGSIRVSAHTFKSRAGVLKALEIVALVPA